MEFKGTKGKWIYNGEFDGEIKDEEGQIISICYTYWKTKDNRQQNALLISKAPELLVMVEELLKELSFHGYNHSTTIYQAKELIKESTTL